ncbi:outer membrane protein assembly factor [Aestuariicella hydrocarbonica]|uniref:Translocation and assembly module subunit TamA n=1 Tax=Pseudomaricurvus hydrocarbonicus TaxID=1470433 RepID=A0A9E5JUT7_9GAMM|nr:autotransporter assembly complex family protein [Aestuariicella hydrocarbonica]NHO66959.1 outer membrane protein assembly factor [Aestuariicella hydrocarbonica]
MGRATLGLFLVCFAVAAAAKLEVKIEPSHKEVKENIQAFVGAVEPANQAELTRLAKHVDEQASRAAQALGYYHSTNHIEFAGTDDKPVIKLKVVLGPPVTLRHVNIEIDGPGQGTDAFTLPETTQLATGMILNHGTYEDLKTLIQHQALAYGYFSGTFLQKQLLVDVEHNKADINLTYQTGPRYRLGEVAFTDTVFNADLLNSLVPFKSGDFYTSDRIAAFNRALLASGYFMSVKVTPQPDLAVDNVIPIQVALVERDPHSLGFGGGYSTDVGPRAKATWDQHWLNAEGDSRGAAMELSTVRQQLSTYYKTLLEKSYADDLRYFAGLQFEDIDEIETESVVVGAELYKRLESNWERTYGLRLEHDVFSLGQASGETTLLIPSLAFHRVHTSSQIDPAWGYRMLVEFEGAKEDIISSVDFASVTSQIKGLYTFFGRHRVLGRLSLGVVATNSFEDIPPSHRYFAGGDQSVRGYDYQQLSPRDSDGENIGGRYLLAGSLEYQYQFLDKWRVAGFMDHGNAVNSLNDPLKTSVGLGLRWVSPIGSIRIDVARSLSDPDEGFRIHFSMGPEL